MEERFLGLIEQSIKKHWDLKVFSDYKGEISYRYSDFASKIAEMHILLEKAGIKEGDKVALIGKNSSNWAVSFFSILSYGAVVVPILHDFKPANIHHIINHSDSIALFVAEHNWVALDVEQIPAVHLIVMVDDFSVIKSADPEVKKVPEQMNELFQAKYPNGFTADDLHFYEEESDQLALISYTSGTTSSSKGVMIPFRSLWSNTQYAYDNIPFIHAGDNFVCMLPMAHMYGLAFEILNGVNKGCHINFLTRTPSPKVIVESFSELKPTLILAVPLIIEKIVKSQVFPVLKKPLIKFLCAIPGIKGIIYGKIKAKLDAAFGGKFEEIIIGGARPD